MDSRKNAWESRRTRDGFVSKVHGQGLPDPLAD